QSDVKSAQRDAKTDMRVLRRKDCLPMSVIGRNLSMHGLMHPDGVSHNFVGRDWRRVIHRAVVFRGGLSAAGESVAVIRLAAIQAPMTEKIVLGHLDGVKLCDIVRESIQLQRTEPSL